MWIGWCEPFQRVHPRREAVSNEREGYPVGVLRDPLRIDEFFRGQHQRAVDRASRLLLSEQVVRPDGKL